MSVPLHVLRFDSIEGLISLAETRPIAMDRLSPPESPWGDWHRGVIDCREGRPDLAGRIGAGLGVEAATGTRDAHEWHDDRYIGASVSIGRYSAGLPGCVRRRERQPTDYRHVGVYVSLASSAALSGDDLVSRGAALLGLISRLASEGVSSDLYVCGETGEAKHPKGDVLTVCRVPTVPLDLSQLAGILCSPHVSRGLLLGVEIEVLGSPEDGPWPSCRGNDRAYREAIGLASHDVLVSGWHAGEGTDLDGWIERHARQALGTGTEVTQ